jgi:hypothetical protein
VQVSTNKEQTDLQKGAVMTVKWTREQLMDLWYYMRDAEGTIPEAYEDGLLTREQFESLGGYDLHDLYAEQQREILINLLAALDKEDKGK